MHSNVFFFQAEDGIRDLIVTGVQTCALPISRDPVGRTRLRFIDYMRIFVYKGPVASRIAAGVRPPALQGRLLQRSEERRVGKECRSLCWQEQYRKKTCR